MCAAPPAARGCRQRQDQRRRWPPRPARDRRPAARRAPARRVPFPAHRPAAPRPAGDCRRPAGTVRDACVRRGRACRTPPTTSSCGENRSSVAFRPVHVMFQPSFFNIAMNFGLAPCRRPASPAITCRSRVELRGDRGMPDRKQGPLAGIRVLDFSTLLPGPLATLILAEAGAEVIKFERPDGEDMRRFEPKWGKESVAFAMLNRGKKSVAADLKDPQVRERVLALARTADIVVEQFRPGVMDRLGLGYAAFRGANPRIVYCAISGYGQSGPRAMRAGHDLNYIGDAGLLALSSGPPGHRVVPPALTADIAGASYPAVMNILLALRQRDATGEGTFIDVSMADCVFPFMFWALGEGFATGQWPGSGTSLLTGGTPRYRLYETRDGKVACVAAIEQRFWTSFCAAIGLDRELIDDTRDRAATVKRVTEIIAAKTAAE